KHGAVYVLGDPVFIDCLCSFFFHCERPIKRSSLQLLTQLIMSGTNVWTRSRDRMRQFPELFAQCAGEAAAYGKCVTSTTTGRQDLKKDMCIKEFDALKTCFVTSAKKGVK
ncbi:hypothetical protein UPYG_G00135500, partial [Umbra pygmaea]